MCVCVKLLFIRDSTPNRSDPAADVCLCMQNNRESVKWKVRDERGGSQTVFPGLLRLARAESRCKPRACPAVSLSLGCG